MTILGTDDRVRVPDTLATLNRAVVYIETLWPDGQRTRATGSMVGRDDVLTAGHVVFSPEHGGYAKQVTVIPAMQGSDTQPFGSAAGVSWFAADRWTQYGNWNDDLGYIKLDRNLGDYTGTLWLDTRPRPDSLTDAPITTIGYPGDKGYGVQWSETGRIDLATDDTLDFTSALDVIAGQSGSPILDLRGGQRTIVGIISNASPVRNQAIRLHGDFIAQLAQRMAGDAPEPWPVSPSDAGNIRELATDFHMPFGALGTVGSNTDAADWFRFDVAYDGTLNATLSGLGNNLDLHLIDADGTELARSSHAGTTTETISYKVQAGHKYYFYIEPVAGLLSGYALTGQVTPVNGAALTAISGQASLIGTDAAEVLRTGNQSVAQVIVAGGGDDRIEIGDGDRTIDGGAGRDLVALPGQRANYDVRMAANGDLLVRGYDNAALVAHSTGANGQVLRNVEYVQFSDEVLFVLPRADADVARLYTAALGRRPDSEGIQQQLTAMDRGTSIQALADNFAASAEFTRKYGNLSDSAFVERLYVNALGRAGEAEGVRHWVSYLQQGHDRGDVLLGFATSAEHAAQTASWLLLV